VGQPRIKRGSLRLRRQVPLPCGRDAPLCCPSCGNGGSVSDLANKACVASGGLVVVQCTPHCDHHQQQHQAMAKHGSAPAINPPRAV
jgi:hypothetical protein